MTFLQGDGAEYQSLVRIMGRELLGLPADERGDDLSDGNDSSANQREEDQIRVACVDGHHYSIHLF